MKVNSINRQNFKGDILSKANFGGAAKFISKHPEAIAALAGSSVIAQKIVMSGSEATIGPVVDLAVGKALTNATDEQDDRIMQSSKVQAVRTTSQSIGGTITGVIIRGICIAATTLLFTKLGQKTGGALAKIINPKNETNLYKYTSNMEKWGKNVGGAVAIIVMMFTNFLIDAPFINWINKNITKALKIKKDDCNKNEVKEAK